MDATEKEKGLAASNAMAEAIFGGSFLLQMIAWRAVIARREARFVGELGLLEKALRGFVDLRERGLAEGGPPHITAEDAEKVGRLATLVSAWLTGGALSPDIEPLARSLFTALGGDASALPPEDAA
jgi:hypothetical protein